jgi:hypothetical protein
MAQPRTRDLIVVVEITVSGRQPAFCWRKINLNGARGNLIASPRMVGHSCLDQVIFLQSSLQK